MMRTRWIVLVELAASMKDTRLPKCMVFGELVGDAGCVGSQEKE